MATFEEEFMDPEIGYPLKDGKPSQHQDYSQFMEKEVRRGFIRKVFGILSVQLFFTFVVTLTKKIEWPHSKVKSTEEYTISYEHRWKNHTLL